MANTKIRTRYAPSPTGIPHIGNSRTALFDYLIAKKYQGQFILRLEDTDQKRFVPGSTEKIYEIVHLLGIDPDESPEIGGPYGPYIQTGRLEIYQKFAHELVEKGAAYYCFCTPDRLQSLKQSGSAFSHYDKHCLSLTKEEIEENLKNNVPHVIRINMPTSGFIAWHDLVQGKISLPYDQVDDKVLLKSDGIPTYHLAVVIDDHLMAISHILRGVEWISSTPVQLKLFESLGWEPPIFAHVPLLLGPDKSKLSKRHGAKSVLGYCDDGYLPEAINNFLFYLGFSYHDNSETLTLGEMVKAFDETKIQKQNAIFDIQKLNYFNSRWIKRLSDVDLLHRILNFVPIAWKSNPDLIRQIIPLVKDRLYTLRDFEPAASFFFDSPVITKTDLLNQSGQSIEETADWLNQVIAALNPDKFSPTEIHETLKALQEKSRLDPRQAFMTIRYAITGRTVSPPIFDVISVLGLEESKKRLVAAVKTLI